MEKSQENYILSMRAEIERDENEAGATSTNSDYVGNENSNNSKPSGVRLSDLLAGLGKGNKPTIFIIKKIRTILSTIASKGLNEKSIIELKNQAEVLAANDEFKAELLMQIIREAGYDLDSTVPTHMAFIALVGLDFVQLRSMAVQLKQIEMKEQELNDLGNQANESEVVL